MFDRYLRGLPIAVSVLIVVTVAVGAVTASPAVSDPEGCAGEPATTYSATAAGNDATGTVEYSSSGGVQSGAFAISTNRLVGHPSVIIEALTSTPVENVPDPGIEFRPQTRPTPPYTLAMQEDFWKNPVADTVVLTFDLVAADARVRLRQALDG